jgi:hypothetical protein
LVRAAAGQTTIKPHLGCRVQSDAPVVGLVGAYVGTGCTLVAQLLLFEAPPPCTIHGMMEKHAMRRETMVY